MGSGHPLHRVMKGGFWDPMLRLATTEVRRKAAEERGAMNFRFRGIRSQKPTFRNPASCGHLTSEVSLQYERSLVANPYWGIDVMALVAIFQGRRSA